MIDKSISIGRKRFSWIVYTVTNTGAKAQCLCFQTSVNIFYRPQLLLRKCNVFTRMCQEICPQGGTCMAGAVHGGGMPERGTCMAGVACVAGWHAWSGACVTGGGMREMGGMCGRGTWVAGGMHGRRYAWQGGVRGGGGGGVMHGRRDGHCCGRYAFYWNAFH